jgi:hypothetical protein
MSNLTQAWLEDQTSIRCLLVEITALKLSTNTEITFYLSNAGYTTTTADVSYLPYLTGSLQTTESLGIDNSLSMSFGDIQVANFNGELDSWLDSTQYIWVNRGVRVYLGDPRWTAATITDVHTVFEKIFDGVVADVDSSSREYLNIKVRDKLQRLNYPLSDNTLGIYGTWAGGQTNQDTIRPLVFGEVNNISPVLIDPSKLEYMFNDTSIGTLITATTATTNTITCNSVAGFLPNKPIIFTFDTTKYPSGFGGLTSGTTYYIKTINTSANTITVSTLPNGVAVTLTTATLTTTGSITNAVQAEVSITSTELVIEIRDNGVPIYTDSSIYTSSGTRPQGATVDLVTGKFTLKSPPSGTVTCSVQGVKRSVDLTPALPQFLEGTYTDNIAKLIAVITTQYGQPNQRLSFSDLDLTNFSAFANTQTAAVGTVVLDRTNTLNVCQDLANSAAAQLFFNRAGLLQLLILGTPTTDTPMSITDSDILHHSLHISQRTPVTAATKIGYCQNYTPQTALAASIPSTANTMFADAWYSNTVVDATVQANYKLTAAPVQRDTKLIAGADCAALATQLNNYFKVPHTVYAFTGTAKLMGLKLGQQVTLIHNRFGLNSGKTGQVITLAPDWAAGTVNVEVII